MRRETLIVLGGLLLAGPLAGQDNPFAFTGGSVKSAYIVYEMTSKEKQGGVFSWEVGVAPDRMITRMVAAFDIGGKKDTLRSLGVITRDSQYTYNRMGAQRGEGKVSPMLRPHLAREYAALDAAGKARFKENLRLGTKSSALGWSSDDMFIALTGDKTGSETIGGQKCDVYKQERVTACVLPQAPMVWLRWTDEKQGVSMVAKKVTLNGPIPAAAGLLPKGVRWKKEDYSDADFIPEIWTMKKQTDPAAVPGATLTKFAVGYLASTGANAELREMSGDASGGDEEVPDEESGEDESGS